ncbi:MAG: hypothetical protein ACRDMY_11950 [Gaiellaceae bacterium]
MRRGITVLVVVVVAAIALAAGFDALRGGSDAEPATQGATEPTVSRAPATEEPASEAEPAGTLYYTDESCELQAIELPAQRPVEAPGWDECRFVLTRDGRRVAGAGSGWDPRSDPLIGRLFQSEDGEIQVSTNRGPEGQPLAGQAPAWRPDGTLTYFADGAVREWPSGRVVISGRQLLAAANSHVNAPNEAGAIRRLVVRHAAWLDPERAVVTIHARVPTYPDLDLAGVFERGRLLADFPTFAPITGLWTSPEGRFWAIAANGLQLQDRRNTLPLPPLVDPVAVAWSPDESHMAVATRASVFVFPPGETRPVRRLPIVANDLDWRGEAGPPPLTDADEAREWLDGLATGRLFVTLPGCRLRALRLPDLVWDEEPDVPAPCRFTLDADGAVLAEDVSAPDGGDLTASCEGPDLHVFQNGGFRARLPNACGAAWMGDGTLTFIREGGLWRGVEDARRLVSRNQVSEILGRPAALHEVAWVDDERFWAVARSGAASSLALMTTDDLVFSPSYTSRSIEGLRVSSSGMVAARSDQGIVIFDSGGRRALTFPNGRAVAWEPGELIAAVATPSEILFVAPVSREVVSLPLTVSDLEWVIP